jgi:hypothetical protein
MKYMVFVLLLLIPVIGLGQSGSAFELTRSGTEYLRHCENATHSSVDEDVTVCAIWTSGVIDGIVISGAASQTPLLKIPDDVETAQLMRIIVKYMNDNPKLLNLSSRLLVLKALRDAYPAK